jgi:site-specific recombinase
MGLAAAVSFSLCLWVALWSLGTKALDGMILVLAILIVAAAIKILSVFLPSQSRRS